MVQMGLRAARRTKLMRRVEEKFSRPLVDLIVEGVNIKGLSRTAEELGVSKATLGYWILKLKIEQHRVLLKPGQTFQIIETR